MLLELVKPDKKYLDSFLSAIAEYRVIDEKHVRIAEEYANLDSNKAKEDFEEYILKPLYNRELGKDLPKGWVPSTQFWIVTEKHYIGTVNIRHALPENAVSGHIGYIIRPSERGQGILPKIFPQIFEQAYNLGLESVVISAHTTNVASLKILQKLYVKYGKAILEPVREENVIHQGFWFYTNLEYKKDTKIKGNV